MGRVSYRKKDIQDGVGNGSGEPSGLLQTDGSFCLVSGVILPGETRKFSFLFKSERAGIFSESWGFRTHPLLLGGALLQVTLWGFAACEDKLADLRENLEVTKCWVTTG